jgi:hypothetical protein
MTVEAPKKSAQRTACRPTPPIPKMMPTSPAERPLRLTAWKAVETAQPAIVPHS